MSGERSQRFKLGLFVLAGTAVLILALYIMGSRKDLFSRSMTVSADFTEVGGLREGNNVRYAGINVGIVETVEILNDTTVRVYLAIRLDEAERDALPGATSAISRSTGARRLPRCPATRYCRGPGWCRLRRSGPAPGSAVRSVSALPPWRQ